MTTRQRVYIAGPMSGHPGFNYAAFDRAEQELAGAGFDAVSPADSAQLAPEDGDALAPGVTYEDCLAQAVERLLECGAVALLPGWEDSHGARLEVALARRRGMDARPLHDWLDECPHLAAVFGLPPRTTVDPMGSAPCRDPDRRPHPTGSGVSRWTRCAWRRSRRTPRR